MLVAGVATADKAKEKTVPEALNFTVTDINGNKVNLADKYKGKVVLIVNTASKCGFTKQYAGLEQLHEKYGDEGLAILGFPCNDFGGQEPGTEAEIAEFCTTKFGVKFDMFSKIKVKGEGKEALYEYLTEKTDPKFQGPIAWNFEKFLIDRDGNVVARFDRKADPASPEVTGVIEEQIKKAN